MGLKQIFGVHRPGLASEYAIVPSRNLLALPHHVSHEEAAAAGLIYLTAWHSLMTRGGLSPGETIVIIGAGGDVNTAFVQIAKLVGATVIVIGSTKERCSLAISLGADEAICKQDNPRWARDVWQITDSKGADVVAANVGTSSLGGLFRAARRGGRVVVTGISGSPPGSKLGSNALFSKELDVFGCTLGSHREYCHVMKLFFSGALRPHIGASVKLAEAREGMRLMEEYVVPGKVVLQM